MADTYDKPDAKTLKAELEEIGEDALVAISQGGFSWLAKGTSLPKGGITPLGLSNHLSLANTKPKFYATVERVEELEEEVSNLHVMVAVMEREIARLEARHEKVFEMLRQLYAEKNHAPRREPIY